MARACAAVGCSTQEAMKNHDQRLEALAALEHEQWAHWTRHMLAHLTPQNVAQWQRQCETPYHELSEHEKESDREWARRALALLGE
jgi:hypothetical protein